MCILFNRVIWMCGLELVCFDFLQIECSLDLLQLVEVNVLLLYYEYV